ncbi:MAG TPA: ribosome maturation factor RimM, partial [Xanthobacteraceae bacterium]|nr:ribosome maturation factor RimM [Xanthobacteraceae bacterium]
NAAEALTNTRLYVARAKLPKPADDEFYHADLIGLAATTADGAAFGTVKAVHNFGAGDLLEIEPASGGTSVMLPFTETSVPTVDIAGRKLIVAPPADV